MLPSQQQCTQQPLVNSTPLASTTTTTTIPLIPKPHNTAAHTEVRVPSPNNVESTITTQVHSNLEQNPNPPPAALPPPLTDSPSSHHRTTEDELHLDDQSAEPQALSTTLGSDESSTAPLSPPTVAPQPHPDSLDQDNDKSTVSHLFDQEKGRRCKQLAIEKRKMRHEQAQEQRENPMLRSHMTRSSRGQIEAAKQGVPYHPPPKVVQYEALPPVKAKKSKAGSKNTAKDSASKPQPPAKRLLNLDPTTALLSTRTQNKILGPVRRNNAYLPQHSEEMAVGYPRDGMASTPLTTSSGLIYPENGHSFGTMVTTHNSMAPRGLPQQNEEFHQYHQQPLQQRQQPPHLVYRTNDQFQQFVADSNLNPIQFQHLQQQQQQQQQQMMIQQYPPSPLQPQKPPQPSGYTNYPSETVLMHEVPLLAPAGSSQSAYQTKLQTQLDHQLISRPVLHQPHLMKPSGVATTVIVTPTTMPVAIAKPFHNTPLSTTTTTTTLSSTQLPTRRMGLATSFQPLAPTPQGLLLPLLAAATAGASLQTLPSSGSSPTPNGSPNNSNNVSTGHLGSNLGGGNKQPQIGQLGMINARTIFTPSLHGQQLSGLKPDQIAPQQTSQLIPPRSIAAMGSAQLHNNIVAVNGSVGGFGGSAVTMINGMPYLTQSSAQFPQHPSHTGHSSIQQLPVYNQIYQGQPDTSLPQQQRNQ